MTVYTAYHGSTRAFDKPSDFSKLKNMDFGPGLYFALDAHDASSYGPYLYKAEVRVDRPIVVSPDEIDQNFVRRFAKALGANDDDIRIGVEEGAHPIETLFGLALTLVQVETFSLLSLRKFLIKLGYDGVLVDPRVPNRAMERHGASTRLRGGYVVVFSPEQVLSWERVEKLRPNTIPPPPTALGDWRLWFKKTYAPGTRVKTSGPVTFWSQSLRGGSARTRTFDTSTRGVVVETWPDMWAVVVEEGMKKWYYPIRLDTLAEMKSASDDFEPLDDNWGPLVTAPLHRHQLPPSQKRTSRKLRPNAVPPPPSIPSGWNRIGKVPRSFLERMDEWIRRTFAPGTRVRFLEEWTDEDAYDDENDPRILRVPAGTIGKVLSLHDSSTAHPPDIEVAVTIVEELFTTRKVTTRKIWVRWRDASWQIEPLDDNWGPLVIPSSQKRTSRKLRPNTIPRKRTSRRPRFA